MQSSQEDLVEAPTALLDFLPAFAHKALGTVLSELSPYAGMERNCKTWVQYTDCIADQPFLQHMHECRGSHMLHLRQRRGTVRQGWSCHR